MLYYDVRTNLRDVFWNIMLMQALFCSGEHSNFFNVINWLHRYNYLQKYSSVMIILKVERKKTEAISIVMRETDSQSIGK